MTNIIKAKDTAIQFLKDHLDCNGVKVIKLENLDDKWIATAEAYEDDSFLKSMDLPPKKTRSFFTIQLDANLEIIGFERLES